MVGDGYVSSFPLSIVYIRHLYGLDKGESGVRSRERGGRETRGMRGRLYGRPTPNRSPNRPVPETRIMGVFACDLS